jgi:acyl carrier protein
MLRQPPIHIDIQDQPPSNDPEAAIRTEFEAIVRAILYLAPDSPIRSRTPGDLGLTSLGAITFQYTLQTTWGIELSVGEILEAETVDTLFSLAIARRAAGQHEAEEGVVI